MFLLLPLVLPLKPKTNLMDFFNTKNCITNHPAKIAFFPNKTEASELSGKQIGEALLVLGTGFDNFKITISFKSLVEL